MKILLYILILLLIIAGTSIGQQKYFIYFKDKGEISKNSPSTESSEFRRAKALLTDESIDRRKKVMGENYIIYEDLPINNEYISEIESRNITVIRKLRWFNAVSVLLTENQIGELNSLPFISEIEPVKTIKFIREIKSTNGSETVGKSSLSDLNYGLSQNQLQLSNIPSVHQLGLSGENVSIGILDSGFDWQNHQSLDHLSVLYEYDFVQNDNVTADQEGDALGQDSHGTSVLSIVGGFDDGSLIGSAFGADFMLAKTEYIPTETHVEEDNYAAAVQEMEARGVDITSSSVGYSTFDAGEGSYSYQDMDGNTTIVTQALNKAFQRGVVTITSAGNEGDDAWQYITAPADAFNVISVGAVNNSNSLAGFSSIGPTSDGRIKPEVLAQGVSVAHATSSKTNYTYENGTSYSTPIVAGIAALLLEAHPYLTNSQVRQIFLESSDNAGKPNNKRGYGLLSALEAVQYPNLQALDGNFRINKIFKSAKGEELSNHKIFYSNNSDSYKSAGMQPRDSLAYFYELQGFSNGDTINFYFQYENSSGQVIRVPNDKNYSMVYGELGINLHTGNSDGGEQVPDNYILYQNYPNPFNGYTEIRFDAKESVSYRLTIFNSIGQKIMVAKEGIADVGANYVTWDGTNHRGSKCASGLYFYHLKIDGQQFMKKLLLLK